MTSNARSSSDWRLYVIVDRAASGGRDLAVIAQQAIRGGADVIQLRDKQAPGRELLEAACALLRVTRAAKVPLIVNDRLDVAMAAGADGVHLGQDDVPVADARALLGPGKLIGHSTHSLEQALAADRAPIDYLAVGPIFATPTKPDYADVGLELISQVRARVRKPFVVIGGLDASRLAAVRHAGASCVAVVRAVCGADDPESAARELKRALV